MKIKRNTNPKSSQNVTSSELLEVGCLGVLPGVSFDLCLAARDSPEKKGVVIFRSACLLALK